MNSKTRELVFVTGLGKGTGTMLFKAIDEYYSNPLQNLLFSTTFPFVFEGFNSANNAGYVLEFLSAQTLSYELFI